MFFEKTLQYAKISIKSARKYKNLNTGIYDMIIIPIDKNTKNFESSSKPYLPYINTLIFCIIVKSKRPINQNTPNI